MADAGGSARDGFLGTRTVALALLALVVALLAVAPSAHAVDRQDAGKKALAALGTDAHDDAVIVFGLRSTIAPRTRITEAGPDGAAVRARPARNAFERARNRRIRRAGATFRRSGTVLRASASERSWLFFEDRGPHQAFEHPGRVVLVGERTGTVRVSSRTAWVPLVAGRVPAFFRSAKGYKSNGLRIFTRMWASPGARNRAQSRQAPAPEPRQQVADALAAERSCALRVSDTLGDFFDFGGVDRTRARLGQFFESLENLNAGFVSRRYTTKAGQTPIAAAQDLIDRAGCKDLFLYVAGAGTRTGDGGIVIGLRAARGGRVEWHVLTADQLEGLVKANRDVTFKFLFDAPYTSRLNRSLTDEPNTVLLIASGGPNEASFTYLPEILGPNGVERPSNNPDQLLEFTNAILSGLEAYVRDPQEIEAWMTGRSLGGPSMMAWMMARALALSPAWMFAAPIDTLKIPVMPRPGGDPETPTPPSPVNHTPVPTTPAQPTQEDTPKSFTLTAHDPDGDPLTFTVTDQPDHGTLTGTAPNLVYTPAQDFNGNDALTYSVADNRGASASQTVPLPVTEDNDAAAVVTSTGATPPEFTEDGSAVTVDDQLTINDPDSTQLESATVRILGGFKAGDDVLAVDGDVPSGVSSDYDANDGILTLTGPASLTQYRDMLRSVTFDSTSQDPGTSRTIEFRAEDGDEAGVPATRDLTVVPVNDAPVLDTTDASRAYSEGNGEQAVDSGITVADVDSTQLTGATVQITSNFLQAEDALAFADTLAITHSYDDTTGTLTLTGTASLADYQAALRAVTYENSSDDPSTATRTVSFRVDDGGTADNLSNVATRDVTVARVNDAPVANGAGTLSYTENEPAKQITSTLALSDVDDTNLELGRVAITANQEAGDDLSWTDNDAGDGITLGSDNDTTDVLTLTGTGTVAQYQAALRAVQYSSSNDNPATGKTISFVAGDGDAESAPAEVPVTVTRVNDAPTLDTTDAALDYEEGDGAVAVDGGITVTDPDSTQLTGATVQITSGFTQAEDDLVFASTPTITGSYDDTTGTMMLSGTDTLANYQAALRAVRYQNTSDNPSTATRTVSFRVNDGGAVDNLSNVATRDVTVGPANDAPVVNTSAGATSFTEGGGPTVVDGALTVSDSDDTNLESATVRISQNLETGDVLAFSNTANITGNYAAGTLTLTGTDTVANYQAALRSVTYDHTGDDPQTGKVVEFVANDGDESSNAATKSINITGVNDGPTVTTTATALSYGEGDGEVAVDPGVTVDDPENNTISQAVVSITSGHVAAEDELKFTDANGITHHYDDSAGTLTLSGTASESAYQSALRSVRYANSSDNPSTSTRTVTFRVTDTGTPAEQSNAATRDITVSRVNDAPAVTTSAGNTPYVEGGSASVVDNQLTVSDPDDTNIESATVRVSSNYESGDTLSFSNTATITGNYSAGTLTLSGTDTVANYQAALRSITFSTSNDHPATSKVVEFKVNDGDADSNTPTKTIAVSRTNDNPVLDTTDAALSYTEGNGHVAIDGGLTLTDPDSTQIQSATVQITSNFVAAEDELAFTDTGAITHLYDDTNGKLTLTGTASLADYQAALRSVTYENSSDNPSTSTRTVSFTAIDAEGAASNTATRAITVAGVNDAPVVTTSPGATAYTEGLTPTPVDPGLTVSDVDDTSLDSGHVRIASSFEVGDVLTFVPQNGITGVYDPATGELTLTTPSGEASVADWQAALRSVTYSHIGDAPSPSKTVEFMVNDGSAESNKPVKGLSVTGVNDAPTINTNGGTTSFVEDTSGPVAIDSALTLTDPDSATISGATVSITGGFDDTEDVLASAGGPDIDANYNPTTGVMTLTGTDTVANYQAVLRAVTYDNTDAVGPSTATRTISFQATDSSGAASNTATKNVSVTATNDPPVLTTTNGSTPYTEDAPPVVVDSGIAVSDAEDTHLNSGAVAITSGRQAGDTLAFTATANITGSYDPTTGVLTLDTPVGEASLAEWQTALRSVTFGSTNQTPVTSKTIEFKVNDGDVDSNKPTKEITVTPANDPPVVTSGGTLTYTENDSATAVHPGLTVVEPEGENLSGGSASITANYAAGQDVLDWTDNNLSDNITKDAVNSNAQTVVLTGMDSAANYQAALRAVTYRNSSESPSTSSRTVTFAATDVLGATASDTRTVSVTAVDDPPVAVNDSATVLEDAPATSIPVLNNDTDVDAGPKTIASATDPANGTVVLTGGSPGAHTGLTYQPDPNYCNDPPGTAPDTFTYTLNGGSNATVSMTVTCVNDAPVADDETFNGNDSAHGNTTMQVDDPDDDKSAPTHPHTEITGDILAGDTDVDSPASGMTATPGTFATNLGGSVEIEEDGDFRYHPPASTSCVQPSDYFEYTVEDNHPTEEQTDTGRVTVALVGCVWYVHNFSPGNSGTSQAPFDTLAQAEAASSANHTVFVFDGDNTTTGHDAGGYQMNAGERLIGEHEGLTVDPDQGGALNADTLHPANPGAHPTITANGADVVDLDDGNEIRGFVVDPGGAGGGIFGGSGDTGGGRLDDLIVLDNGTAATQPALELNATTGTFDITNFVTSNKAHGVLLNNAGTVDFGGDTSQISLTTAGGPGFTASNTNMGTSTIDDITVTGSSNGAVDMDGTTGTTVLGDGVGTDLNLTTTGTKPAFDINNAGTITVNSGGTDEVHATGGAAIDITATPGATFDFDDVDSTNSSTAGGASGDGINIDGLGTGTFQATTGDVGGGAGGIGFDLNGGSGTISYGGNLHNGVGATAIEISGRTGGTVTLSGPISDTNDAGGSLVLSENSAGSTTLSHATKQFNTGTSPGVNVTGTNAGHTHALILTGGTLDIDTTSGAGLNADTTGSIEVAGNGNTIDTGTGRALNISNTDIADGDVKFQRISSNGASNGIRLNNTVNAGGDFRVDSSGSGTCPTADLTTPSPTNATCTGGVITNSTGAGISLNSVPGAVELTRVGVTNGQSDGVNAVSVGGFELNHSAIVGNGNGTAEDGLDWTNVTGVSSIHNSDVLNNHAFNARAANTTGTAHLTVQNSDFQNSTEEDGLQLITDGTASFRTNVTNNDFKDNKGDGIQYGSVNASPNAVTDATITNNRIEGRPVDTIDGGIVFSGDGSVRGTITGNTIRSVSVGALIVNPFGTTAGTSFDTTVTGNTIGTAGVQQSGSSDGDGMQLKSPSDGTSKIVMSNNNIRGWQGAGMRLRASESTNGATTHLTAQGNTIGDHENGAADAAIWLQAGSSSSDVVNFCANVGGAGALANTFTGGPVNAPAGIADFVLDLRFPNAVLRLPNYTGTTLANRQSYFLGRNTGFTNFAQDGVQNPQNEADGACDLPSAPASPTAPTPTA